MERLVIGLGFFDSLHIGHISLLTKVKKLADKLSAKPMALTFDDGFFPALNKDTLQVFTLSEREKLLQGMGICAYAAVSDGDFLQISGEEFLLRLKSMGVVGIVAGEDYHYGHKAACGINELVKFCKANNMELIIAPTVMQEGKKISSSDIRAALILGDIVKANALLGMDYHVSGEVVHGRGEGGKMGMPTANIYPPNIKQLPKEGVYRTYVIIDGNKYRSVTNVGAQPTFSSNSHSVETLIIDFNDNIYGKTITVAFLERIRDIVRFDSKEALIQQITKDIEVAKND